jgi:hypothetical protein
VSLSDDEVAAVQALWAQVLCKWATVSLDILIGQTSFLLPGVLDHPLRVEMDEDTRKYAYYVSSPGMWTVRISDACTDWFDTRARPYDVTFLWGDIEVLRSDLVAFRLRHL